MAQETKSSAGLPEVLPSFFCTIASRESKQLLNHSELERQVRFDPIVEARTIDYRKRRPISKEFADEVKLQMPGITASALMDGEGKELRNLLKETHWLATDVDDIPKELMQQIIQKADQDEHTMARYITVSGKGLRILSWYETPKDDDFTMLEIFNVMIHKAMDYYSRLLGVPADEKCSDITRMCGISHDKTAYFNWESTPFTLDMGDVKRIYNKRLAKEHEMVARTKRKQRSINQKMVKMVKGVPTMEEASLHIQNLLEQWGLSFESGRHNEYVLAFGKVCVRYGIDQNEAFTYANEHFSAHYPKTESVMKQCYKHTELLETWHFYRKGEKYDKHASVKAMKQWLQMRYEFHQNIVTGFYEIKSRDVVKGKLPHWTRLDDKIENTLWRLMEEDGIHVMQTRLHSVINSDFSEGWDPLDDYLRSLPQWDGKHDYIDELATRIHVTTQEGYHHTQEDFAYFFKKWFVSMVVGWVSPKVVSQTILILIGRGGIFKTTFFNYLLPPCLQEYFINDSTACYSDKDYMEAFSSKALMCLDEFETAFGKSLSAFKSNVTKLFFSIRRPYDKYRSELMHRAALCGTSNSIQIISDEENRRYSPWLIESILNPQENPIPYQQLYAQAVALGQQVSQRKQHEEDDWVYWLTRKDIQKMQQHNKMFMISNFMEDQIMRFYRVPDETTSREFVKFRFSSEIMERIGYSPAMSRNMSQHNLSTVMTRLGFKKIHRNYGNGWIVVEKQEGEQNSEAIVSPSELT